MNVFSINNSIPSRHAGKRIASANPLGGFFVIVFADDDAKKNYVVYFNQDGKEVFEVTNAD